MLAQSFFSFLSHLFGRHSEISGKVSQGFNFLLNVLLAVVCVGYITHFLVFLFPVLSSSAAFIISSALLLAAIPYETIDVYIKNKRHRLHPSIPWVEQRPMLAQIIAVVSTILGSLQYLIRHFSLMFNFTRGRMGILLLRRLAPIYRITALSFSIVGGTVAFMTHFLLSYGNWDKFLAKQERRSSLVFLTTCMWAIPVILLMSMLKPTAALLSVATLLAIWGVSRNLGHLMPATLQKKWIQYSWVLLPCGACLYALVDFYHAHATLGRLGLLNQYTLLACMSFGILSWSNIVLLWGHNTISMMHTGVASTVDEKYPSFVKTFYSSPSVRRVMSYTKEALLCGLDFFNNRLLLEPINWVVSSTLGLSLNLFFLNVCTFCYAINRMVVLYFQSDMRSSAGVSKKIIDQSESTVMAQTCHQLITLMPLPKEKPLAT